MAKKQLLELDDYGEFEEFEHLPEEGLAGFEISISDGDTSTINVPLDLETLFPSQLIDESVNANPNLDGETLEQVLDMHALTQMQEASDLEEPADTLKYNPSYYAMTQGQINFNPTYLQNIITSLPGISPKLPLPYKSASYKDKLNSGGTFNSGITFYAESKTYMPKLPSVSPITKEQLQNEEDGEAKERLYIEVTLDTEFNNRNYISMQLGLRYRLYDADVRHEHYIVIIDSKYREGLEKQKREMWVNIKNQLGLKDFTLKYEDDISGNTEQNYLIKHILLYLSETHPAFDFEFLNIKLIFFYSIKDLTIAMGINNMLSYYIGKKTGANKNRSIFFVQYRIIMGALQFEDAETLKKQIKIKIYLADLFGLQTGGLKLLAESVGQSINIKETLDSYKKNMGKALEELPETFLTYALWDVKVLFTILDEKIKYYSNILFDVFLIQNLDERFHIHNFPLTLGKLVFRIFEKYFFNITFKADECLYLAYLKQSVIDPLHPAYCDNLKQFNKLRQFTSLKELRDFASDKTNSEAYDKLKILFKNKVFLFKPIQYASIKALIDTCTHTTGVRGALIAGGRTVNERPETYQILRGADIDISSAYGTEIAKLGIPIGRPRIYAYTPTQKRITLREFLKKHRHDLTSNLWKVLVTGPLHFTQDLIFSKVVSASVLEKRIARYDRVDPDSATIPNDFLLLRKEIINGSITHKLLEILEKVATKQELSQIFDLEIETAIFWLDSDRCPNIYAYAEESMKDRGEYIFDSGIMSTHDTRTYKWYLLPLEEYIVPLLKKRKELKQLKTDPSSFAMEQALKGVVNTTWGIIASVYFDINNTVVAEIVTANVRGSIWLMSKALNTHLSITDGGPYGLTNVTFLKEGVKKPGLETWSTYANYSKHKNITLGNLAGIDWACLIDQNISPDEFPNHFPSELNRETLDTLAQKHVSKLWANYGITITFTLEHKLKNVFKKAAYINKAHYAFQIYDPEQKQYSKNIFSIRGLRKSEIEDRKTLKINPVYYILESILLGKDTLNNIKGLTLTNLTYSTKKLLRLPAWRLRSKNLTIKEMVKHLPGEEIEFISKYRLNNKYIHINTFDEYKTIDRRAHSKKAILFEKYLEAYGIKKTLELLNKNDLRFKYNKKDKENTKSDKKGKTGKKAQNNKTGEIDKMEK